MKVGMYGGKFLPFHQGHAYMINKAAKEVDKLYVIVSASEKRDQAICQRDGCKYMPGHVRASWIGEFVGFSRKIEVLYLEDEYSEEDYNWELEAEKIKKLIPDMTHIFYSDRDYFKIFHKCYPGVSQVLIDPERKRYNISATEIRKNPMKHWNMLTPQSRKFFKKKIAIVGTESVGKSTLAALLSYSFDYDNVTLIHEVGRDYCVRYSNQLTPDIIDRIAMEHYMKIEDASTQYVVIDSEAVTTQYYLNMYFKRKSFLIDEIIKKQEFDLMIYLEPDVPWVDDGIRFAGDPGVREKNNKYLKSMFGNYGFDCRIVSGTDWDYRERIAMDYTEELKRETSK